MAKRKLSQNRIVLAFIVAIVADLIQIPVNAVTGTGILAIPGEIADVMIDFVVMAVTSMLLGFHWLLLPSLFLEVIPGFDLLPAWTGCVALVVRIRRKEQALPPEKQLTQDGDVGDATTPTAAPLTVAALPPSLEGAVERRLQKLNDLLGKNLISQSEYDAKRQQILAGI